MYSRIRHTHSTHSILDENITVWQIVRNGTHRISEHLSYEEEFRRALIEGLILHDPELFTDRFPE